MAHTIRSARQCVRTLLSLGIALGASIPVTSAAPLKRDGVDEVRSCSRRGHGCVTAPVRRGRAGSEVRLPGGTWIGCAGDCREALIDQTVDFWDRQQDTAPEGSN